MIHCLIAFLQLWCYLRRRRSTQRSMLRAWRVLSGETVSCLLMGQSLSSSRSLGYIGRHGLTKTKTTLLTVRYVHSPLTSLWRTDSCSLDHQLASKLTNCQLLVGSHQQHAQCMGFPKHPYFQQPQMDLWPWWMDVGQFHISIWDLRSPSTGSSLQIRKHITTGSQRCIIHCIQSSMDLTRS